MFSVNSCWIVFGDIDLQVPGTPFAGVLDPKFLSEINEQVQDHQVTGTIMMLQKCTLKLCSFQLVLEFNKWTFTCLADVRYLIYRTIQIQHCLLNMITTGNPFEHMINFTARSYVLHLNVYTIKR